MADHLTQILESLHLCYCVSIYLGLLPDEPRQEKTCLRSFRPGPTQTRLYIHRRWLAAGNLGFRKKRDCTISLADQLCS